MTVLGFIGNQNSCIVIGIQIRVSNLIRVLLSYALGRGVRSSLSTMCKCEEPPDLFTGYQIMFMKIDKYSSSYSCYGSASISSH